MRGRYGGREWGRGAVREVERVRGAASDRPLLIHPSHPPFSSSSSSEMCGCVALGSGGLSSCRRGVEVQTWMLGQK